MRTALVILPALILATTGCDGLQGLQSALMNANVFTTQDEIQFGDGVAAEIEKTEKIHPDPFVQNYVREVGQRVAAHSPRTDVTYTFTVIDSPEVNAFAVPGGHIYVYSGLLKKINDESELAGVLAHEVGHVGAKHSMKQLTREMGYDLISQMLLGKEPGQWAQTGSQIVHQLGFLHFSREQESEADLLAVDILAETGDDPLGLARFLDKLAAMETYEPGAVEQMLRTHPAPSDRRAAVVAEIRKRGLVTTSTPRPIPPAVQK